MAKNGNGSKLAFEEKDKVSGYVQEPEAKKLAVKVVESYKDKEKRKIQYERQWFLNHCAIVGHHYVEFNREKNGGVFETPKRSGRAKGRVQVNLIKRYYMATLSLLCGGKPGTFIAPQTTDQKDIDKSEIGMHVLAGEKERLNFNGTMWDFVGWVLESNALLQWYWDANAGPPLFQEVPQTDPMTGGPMVDPSSGMPVMSKVPVTDKRGRQVHRGEAAVRVVSPFEFDVDGDATDLHKNARWCRIDIIESLDEIRERRPELGQYVQAEDVYQNDLYKMRHRNVVGQTSVVDDPEKIKNAAVTHYYWERPSAAHPKGLYLEVAGDILLNPDATDHPYQRMLREGFWCNLVHAGQVKIAGRFWYSTLIEDGFPVNRLMNKALTQEEENRAKLGNSILLKHVTTKITEGSWKQAESGEVITYDGPPGMEPKVVTPAATSQSTEITIDRCIYFIQEVLASHEASKGESPSTDPSGRAIDLLQKADRSVHGVTTGIIENAYEQSDRMLLSLCAEFWTEERLSRVTGEDRKISAKKVMGSDFDSDDPGFTFDVRIVPQSTMAKDPAEQRAELDHLIQMKLLDPMKPEHRDIALKAYGRADLQELYRPEKLDSAYARDENDMMADGTYPVAQEFENHSVHIREHEAFFKTARFREMTPERQKAALQHNDSHYQLEVQKQTKLAQMQAGVQAAAQSMLQPPVPAGTDSLSSAGGVPGGGTSPAAPGAALPMNQKVVTGADGQAMQVREFQPGEVKVTDIIRTPDGRTAQLREHIENAQTDGGAQQAPAGAP